MFRVSPTGCFSIGVQIVAHMLLFCFAAMIVATPVATAEVVIMTMMVMMMMMMMMMMMIVIAMTFYCHC